VGGLGLAAAAYVGVDYLSHMSPSLHGRLQPALWATLALATAARAPFYRRWDAEIRAAPKFLAAMIFMLAALLCEAVSVRFVSAVLGLQWHRYHPYTCCYRFQDNLLRFMAYTVCFCNCSVWLMPFVQ
jgi:hypothetical protein